jgi:hypothetical protein
MAPQRKTFAAIRKAQATPGSAQERLRTWIFGNYFKEYHMSTKVTRTVVLTRAEFDQVYVEPARERWALEPPLVPAREPEALPDSQRAWSSLTVSATRSSSAAADNSTGSGEPYFPYGMRSSRQLNNFPELLSEQPELDEVGSGYESDVSHNADSSETSSITGSDSSSILYTHDASSSDSDNEDSSDSDNEGSSDSDHESSSDTDNEAQSISSRVNAVTSPEHQERSNAVQEHEESNDSANESPETLPLPVDNGIAVLGQRLIELDQAIDQARHILRSTVANSYGEHRASVEGLEALEREYEQLSFSAFCPYCSHCLLERQRLAELERAINRACHVLRTTVAYSRGEYRASVANLEALEHEREQIRSSAFYSHYQ